MNENGRNAVFWAAVAVSREGRQQFLTGGEEESSELEGALRLNHIARGAPPAKNSKAGPGREPIMGSDLTPP